MKTARPLPLGELLGLSCGSLTRTGGTGHLTVLGAPFMSLMSHDHKKGVSEASEIMSGMLESKR
jgi:hypothetical protein